MAKCSRCETEIGFLSTIEVENKKYCVECSKLVKEEETKEQADWERISADDVKDIISVNLPAIEGYRVAEYKKIVNVQVILGVNAWRDLMGSFRSWAGGRAVSLEKELKAGFQLANEDLKKEAFLLGANAVIGVEFDGGMELAGDAGKNDKMMVVSATGTAVVIEKI
jgi:uncharacterized protein YbjQ (UPF0145 family)